MQSSRQMKSRGTLWLPARKIWSPVVSGQRKKRTKTETEHQWHKKLNQGSFHMPYSGPWLGKYGTLTHNNRTGHMSRWSQRSCSFEHFESVEMAYQFLLKTIILPLLEGNAEISLPHDNLCATRDPPLPPLLATRSKTKIKWSGQQSKSWWSSGQGQVTAPRLWYHWTSIFLLEGSPGRPMFPL